MCALVVCKPESQHACGPVEQQLLSVTRSIRARSVIIVQSSFYRGRWMFT